MPDPMPTAVEITWWGHATAEITIAGTTILTDPVIRRRLGALVRREGLPQAEPSTPDAILLSHLHLDHADVPSLRHLPAPVLTDPDAAIWARRIGLDAPLILRDSWVSVGTDVEVRLVRADHHSRPMPHRPNEAVGMLIRSPDALVWFAGDTSLFEGMEELPVIGGREIDLALVPVGGWGPRLSPGHMGPDEGVEAVRRVGARHAVPIHYGTLHPMGWPDSRLGWMDAPGLAFENRMATEGTSAAHRLAVGESVSIPTSAADTGSAS